MSAQYIITSSYPTPEEHINLRRISGLTPPPAHAVPAALANSVHCIVARTPEGEAIGMVRCVGDGALALSIIDMCVQPDHQGRGIGKRMLDDMLRWVDENAPDAYLMLIGDEPGQGLYKSRGFVNTKGIGMKRSAWGK